MRFRLGRRARLGVLVAVVLGVAAGGIAYASIPDSNGVIHGCYAQKDGRLRVINTDAGASCNTTKENPLNWNQAGPPGPSDAYYGSNDYMRVGGGDTTLVSVDVPAGSYTVAAKTHVYNAVENSFAICELRAAGTAIDGNINRLIAPANDQVVPFLGAASLPAGGTISLVCNGNGVTTVESENSRLVTTKVGTLH